MEDDFSIFYNGNFFSFHFHSILKIFHSMLKFSFIFNSIHPYQRSFRLEAMQRIFCCLASLQCCKQPVPSLREGQGGPCLPFRLLVTLPISIYLKYVFGTSRNDKTTCNNGKRNKIQHNSRLKFYRFFGKVLAANCCTKM